MTYGIVATSGGVSVDKASDAQIAFSSNWPILKIHAVVPVSVKNASPAFPPIIYTHNLGYAPAFMVVSDGPSPNILANKLGQTEANMTSSGFFVDTTNLYYDGFFPDFPKGFVIIFEFDIINKVITSPVEFSSFGQPSGSNEVGVEIATQHHSVDSANPRDIQLTTANRPMQIHMSGSFNQKGVTPFTITHGLGYLPVCLVYAQLGNRVELAEVSISGDLNTLSFLGVQAEFGTGFYLILKDAFNAKGAL
jgi:hypothetical protein